MTPRVLGVAVLLALLAAPAGGEDRRLDELDGLRTELVKRRAAALTLARRGLQALEKNDGVVGAALLADAAAETSALVPLARRARELTAAIVSDSVAGLDADDYAAREAATERLCGLDPSAVDLLEAARPGLGAEGRHRMAQVIAIVKSVDEEGRLHQWAMGAKASSEYSDSSWSAEQATGEPDTPTDGDHATAWATKEPNAGLQWLELDYALPVLATAVRVRETFNPGAVVKIEGKEADGTWAILWQGQDPTRVSPGWLEVPVAPREPVSKLRVTLDTAAVPGWNEIDAVELVGRSRSLR